MFLEPPVFFYDDSDEHDFIVGLGVVYFEFRVIDLFWCLDYV